MTDSSEPIVKLDQVSLEPLLRMVAEGEHTLAQIAIILGERRGDLYRFLTESDENNARYLRAIAIGESAKRERILAELEAIAYADPKDCFDELGLPLPLPEMPLHARKVVQEFEVKSMRGQPGISTTVKNYSRVEALKLLGQHHKMFVEKHEHEVVGNPYQAVAVPVTKRLPDPDLAHAGVTDAEFTELSPLS